MGELITGNHRSLRIRAFYPADRGWVADLHHAHYRDVEGFDETLHQVVERGLADVVARRGSDRSRGYVLEEDGRPAGCVFLFEEGEKTARIRLFLLGPSLRGRGPGRRLLSHVLVGAREAGFQRVVVCTFDRHRAACALYPSEGFQEIARTACTALGQTQVQRDFLLTLRP